MRQLITTIFLLNLEISFGQVFSYPTINKEGMSITEFIPIGWSIRDSTSGDLNYDKINDFVAVLEHKDSVTLLKTEVDFTDTVTTQPRILIILLHDRFSNKFVLTEQSNSFILNNENPTLDDPYQSIKIEKGILRIDFHLFYNMGSWFVTNTSYKFRFQDNNFVLIGADIYSFHRSTHDFEDYSYNFLTNKWSLTKGNEKSKKKPIVEWHSIDLKELKTFKTFKRPFSWEVTKDIYL